jgi:hypothetical protein
LKAPGAGGYPPQQSAPGQNSVAGPGFPPGLAGTLRSATEDPVIAIDEEGGDVTRVTYWTGSLYPGNAAPGAIGDPKLTGQVHAAIGGDLAVLGINVDLAPCASGASGQAAAEVLGLTRR